MRIADSVLLVKKIAVGIAVTLAADGPVVRTDAEPGKAVEEFELGNVPIQA
jgi:hypothetical protein